MDHALRTISYIADIGDLLVVMARRGPVSASSPTSASSAVPSSSSAAAAANHNQTKICCHIFESDEVN
jgi:amyloid beta A4 precursor protein-binding family A member 2